MAGFPCPAAAPAVLPAVRCRSGTLDGPTVRVDLDAVEHNYRHLRVRGTTIVPVVKADAYGHGLVAVARRLGRSGADHLAVGTLTEAAALRRAGFAGRVTALLGPTSRLDYERVYALGVVPVVHRLDQLFELGAHARSGDCRQDIVVKLDTGMNRLGLESEMLGAAVEVLRSSRGLRLVGVYSHLATADAPSHVSIQRQAERFTAVCRELHALGFTFEASLANSAALLARPDLHFDLQRPGIALYGVNPLRGTPWEERGAGLRPAMTVVAPVIAVHPLRTGEGIGYGLSFVARRDMTIAIVGVGYADGYSRSLSNRAQMVIRGSRVDVVGRVSMQMTAVDVSAVPSVAAGDEACVLGGGPGGVSAEELADCWGTIPYEVLCLLGRNGSEHDVPLGETRGGSFDDC